jgi:hypothetical protein
METITITMDEEITTNDESSRRLAFTIPVVASGESSTCQIVQTPRSGSSPAQLRSPPRLNRCTNFSVETEETSELGLAIASMDGKLSILDVSAGDALLDLLNSPSPTFVLTSPAEVSYDSQDQLYEMEGESIDNVEGEESDSDEFFGVSRHGSRAFRPIRTETERYTTSDRPSPTVHLRPRPRSSRGENFSLWT